MTATPPSQRGAIVLDCETTGFDPGKDRITELAIMSLDSGELLFHSYFNPEMSIPPEVIEITKITDEMVKYAPRFSSLAPRIADIIESAEAVIGYNVAFDRGMLCGEFRRLGDLMKNIRWPILVCAKRIWDVYEPKEKRNLTNAFKRFVAAEGFEGAHGAIADTRATLEVFYMQRNLFGLHGKRWEELDPEQKSWFGPSNHIIWKDGILVANFGKNSGIPVHKIEQSFWRWVADKDFPNHVLKIADWMSTCYHSYPQNADIALAQWAKKEEATL